MHRHDVRPVMIRPARKAEMLSLLVVILVAVFLRTYRLSDIPLGLRYDEAYNGVDALRILAGDRPIFLTGNFGREALFIYLQAASVAILGQTALALRVVSAGFGIAAVILTYPLVAHLASRRVAQLTCAWFAVSLWQVIFSRIGLRTISLPLFCIGVFYCLWRGVEAAERLDDESGRASETDRRATSNWLAACGVLLGAAQYTYTAARALPLVVLAFAAYLLLVHGSLLHRMLPGFLLAGLLALGVFAPELLFFLDHPNALIARANDVSVFNRDVNGGDWLGALATSTERSLGMFGLSGDINWDRNVSGRPIFDPVSFSLFVAGLGLALWRFRKPANALALLWLVVMLAPGFFAARDAPNFLHFTGLVPIVFIFPATAAVELWQVFERRAVAAIRFLPVATLWLAFGAGAFVAYQGYFVSWAHSPDVAFLFDSDRWQTLMSARLLAAAGEPAMYVGAGEPDSPLGQFSLGGLAEARAIRVFNGARTVVVSADGRPVSYLFSAADLPAPDVIDRIFPNQVGTVVARTLAGGRVTRYLPPSAPSKLTPARSLPARFGEALEVTGFDLPRDVRAGDHLTVRWYWRILQPDPRNLTFFNQLLDQAGARRGQLDDRVLAPAYWPAGTSGVSTFDLTVDSTALTGTVSLLVGLYDQATMERLPVIDGLGRTAGNQIDLGPVKVHGTPQLSPPIPTRQPTRFADQIDFVGYGLDEPVTGAGATVTLSLYWSARSRPSNDYTVFVHLLDQQGRLVVGADSPPDRSRYPTSLWDAGEVVADAHVLVIPPGTAPGNYQIEVGLYRPDSGERLAVEDGAGQRLGDRLLFAGPTVR